MRTLDAIQLSAAILCAVWPLDAFVCADTDLNLIATAEGLTTVDPGVP
jgi:hypothetical protein